VAEGPVDGVDLDAVAARRMRPSGGPPGGERAAGGLLGRFMPRGEEVDGAFLLRRVDLCHLGFWTGFGAYFLDGDPRIGPLAEAVLGAQLQDGGWNCHVRNRPSTRHSSFHTTFNVLEGLRIAAARGAIAEGAFRETEARAADFMLQHRRERRKPNGRWPLQKRIPGTLLVEMEKPAGESRWNTLRALRILRRATVP
jgi:hypothetical protein